MIYKKFNVVTVPFPFTDCIVSKKRPALVISSEKYQSITNHCILCMITSAKQSDWSSDVPIVNLKVTGLLKPSKIRFKVFSIPSELIIKRIGLLSSSEISLVKNRLVEIF